MPKDKARREDRMPFGLRRDTLDRAAHLRGDAQALALMLDEPLSRALIIAGDAPLLRQMPGSLTLRHEIAPARALCPDATPIFLGRTAQAPLFALHFSADAASLAPDYVTADLRAIAAQGLVADDELAGLAAAKSLIAWHVRHRFCANCGALTQISEAGWRRDCATCGAGHFPRTDPVAIMAVGDEEHCLLARQARFPPGMWSCLAGFVEPGETIADAVRREVHEEAGIACDDVRLMATQPWPYPSSLMIGCTARPRSYDIRIDRDEIEDARWFTRKEIAQLFAGAHPQGITPPAPFAIAHHLLRFWLEGGA